MECITPPHFISDHNVLIHKVLHINILFQLVPCRRHALYMPKACSLPSNVKLEHKGDILIVIIHKCHKNILLTFAVNLIIDKHRGENKTSINFAHGSNY